MLGPLPVATAESLLAWLHRRPQPPHLALLSHLLASYEDKVDRAAFLLHQLVGPLELASVCWATLALVAGVAAKVGCHRLPPTSAVYPGTFAAQAALSHFSIECTRPHFCRSAEDIPGALPTCLLPCQRDD